MRSSSVLLLASIAAAFGCATSSTSGGTSTGTSTGTAANGTTPSTAATTSAGAPAGGSDLAAMAVNRPAGSTLVVVVRHAEKAPAPAGDPSISVEGTARAQALGTLLQNVPVTAVVVTPTRRTMETAAVVAQARGLTPEPIAFGGSTGEHVNAVASAVRRHAGGVVLVVGHSNTVPAIVNALGGPRVPDLCEPQYSQLFVLEIPAAGGTPRFVRDTYGTADRADAAGCAAMR